MGGVLVPNCLEFSGVNGCMVDCGPLWLHDAGTTLPNGFYWDAVLCPLSHPTGGYWFSSGYGGAHTFLDGMLGTPKSGYAFSGNTWSTAAKSWGGSYRVGVGEWVYRGVRWRTTGGGEIQGYVNGLGDWSTRWTGPVTVPTGGDFVAHGYVGGSGHLNGASRIAAVRAWLNTDPFPSSPEINFVPERQFGAFSGKNPADLFLEFHGGGVTVPDHAPLGFASWTGGPPVRHPGRLCGAGSDGGVSALMASPKPGWINPFAGPLPQWVDDPTCPYGTPIGSLPLPGNRPVPTDAAAFAGCLLFDRFDRDNATRWNSLSPSLGSCESGTLPAVAWNQSAPVAFGIQGGRARYVGPSGTRATATVDCGTHANDVRVTTVPLGERTHCGIVFRFLDANNHYWLSLDTNLSVPGDYLVWGKVVAGVQTVLGSDFNPLGGVTALRAVCDPDRETIRIYKNGAASPVATLTGQTDLACGRKVGLLASPNASTETSFWAAKDWSVRAAP